MSIVSKRENKIFERIVIESGKELKRLYDEEFKEIKKGKHDYLTGADIRSEELILNELQKEKIPYKIVAEEKLKGIKFPLISTDTETGVLYIDPLEGTHNFRRHRKDFGGFGVTIGLVKNGCPVYVLFYNSATDELYKAVKGEGGFMNGKRIRVSDRKPGVDSLDIIFNHWPDIKHVGKYLDKLRGGDNRITDYTPTSCSDAVDISIVARGSADGLVYIYKEADPWDLISALFIEEAGGIVTNIEGKPWYSIDNKDGLMEVRNSMIAGNKYVHQLLFNLYNQ